AARTPAYLPGTVESHPQIARHGEPVTVAEERLDRRRRGGSASPRPHRRFPRGSGFGAVLVVRTPLGPDARFEPRRDGVGDRRRRIRAGPPAVRAGSHWGQPRDPG